MISKATAIHREVVDRFAMVVVAAARSAIHPEGSTVDRHAGRVGDGIAVFQESASIHHEVGGEPDVRNGFIQTENATVEDSPATIGVGYTAGKNNLSGTADGQAASAVV